MPPLTQRRNAAYLNRPIPRFGALDRDPEAQALRTWTGLAVYLGGSVERRLRPTDLGAAYLDRLLHLIAPRRRSGSLWRNVVPICPNDLCVLTVELSGARADV